MTLLLWATNQAAVPPAPAPVVVERNSLIIGPYDLCDPASPVTLVNLSGSDFDRGVAAPSSTTITTDMLDGQQVVGDRSSNRNPSLPVVVKNADTVARTTIVNTLLQIVNKPTWPIWWRPAGGFPVIYDCFRATAPIVSTTGQEAAVDAQTLVLTAPALPFGRSPQPITIPLVGSGIQIFNFDTLPSTGLYGTWQIASGAQREGSGYLLGYPFATVPAYRVGAVLYSGIGRVQSFYLANMSTVTVSVIVNPAAQLVSLELVLWGASGKIYRVPSTLNLQANLWSTVTFDLAAAVDSQTSAPTGGVSETITEWQLDYGIRALTSTNPPTIGFDALAALPDASGVQGALTSYGGLFRLPNVPGSARAPINLALTPVTPSTGFKNWIVHHPPANQPTAVPIIPITQSGNFWSGAAPSGSQYSGTFSVYVSLLRTSSAVTQRTISVYLTQTPGGAATRLQFSGTLPSVPGLIPLGMVHLPIAEQPVDGVSTFTVVLGSDQFASDVFDAILLISTDGETIMCAAPIPQFGVAIDEPSPLRQAAGVFGTSGTLVRRADMVSLAGSCLPLSAPVSVDPGDNQILVYSPDVGLSAVATIYLRWLMDADQ